MLSDIESFSQVSVTPTIEKSLEQIKLSKTENPDNRDRTFKLHIFKDAIKSKQTIIDL